MTAEPHPEWLLRVDLTLHDGAVQLHAASDTKILRYPDGRVSVSKSDAEPEVFERRVVESYVVDPVYAELAVRAGGLLVLMSNRALAGAGVAKKIDQHISRSVARIKELRATVEDRGW